MEEIKNLEEHFEKIKDVKMPEFEGLTPSQVDKIYEGLFEEDSPLTLKEVSEEVLAKVPMYSLVRHYLQIVEGEKSGVKLTQAGYLPTAVVKELYEAQYVMDFVVSEEKKMIKEADVMVATLARSFCDTVGLTVEEKNSVKLTEEGKELLADGNKLFKKIFRSYIEEFNWSFFDGLPECDGLQHLSGYVLYLVRKFGRKKMSVEFYYNKFMTAFPMVQEEFLQENEEKELMFVFYLRAFERFLENFGLIEVIDGNEQKPVKDYKIAKSPIFDEIITFTL